MTALHIVQRVADAFIAFCLCLGLLHGFGLLVSLFVMIGDAVARAS